VLPGPVAPDRPVKPDADVVCLRTGSEGRITLKTAAGGAVYIPRFWRTMSSLRFNSAAVPAKQTCPLLKTK
jgi:hypothetical protein